VNISRSPDVRRLSGTHRRRWRRPSVATGMGHKRCDGGGQRGRRGKADHLGRIPAATAPDPSMMQSASLRIPWLAAGGFVVVELGGQLGAGPDPQHGQAQHQPNLQPGASHFTHHPHVAPSRMLLGVSRRPPWLSAGTIRSFPRMTPARKRRARPMRGGPCRVGAYP